MKSEDFNVGLPGWYPPTNIYGIKTQKINTAILPPIPSQFNPVYTLKSLFISILILILSLPSTIVSQVVSSLQVF
jgi:hypothetical protein